MREAENEVWPPFGAAFLLSGPALLAQPQFWPVWPEE